MSKTVLNEDKGDDFYNCECAYCGKKLHRYRCKYEKHTIFFCTPEHKIAQMRKEAYQKIEDFGRENVIKSIEEYGQKATVQKIHLRRNSLKDWLRDNDITVRKLPKYSIKIPEEEWKIAYLAGFIDGEGTIRLRLYKQKRDYPCISIANTNYESIQWVKENFGGSIRTRPRKPPRKEIYTWNIENEREILKLLKVLTPYLIIKKENALLVLDNGTKKDEKIKKN